MKKFLMFFGVVGVFAAIVAVDLGIKGFQSLQGQVVMNTQTKNAMHDGKDIPSNEADLGILLKANAKNHFSCGGREGIQFTLLGPDLDKDTTTKILVKEYDWGSSTPNGNVFYSVAERQADHSLPPSTLRYFTRGKEYDVETTKDLFMQCGLNMDTVYSCGNGITEPGAQNIASIGYVHKAEQCDGGTKCTKDCQNVK